jgi:hypothetical protein
MSFHRVGAGALLVSLVALTTGAASGCSGKNREATGSLAGSTEEALVTSDKLSRARPMPMRKANASPRKLAALRNQAASGALTYRGGPLLQHVKVYTVFWGSGVASQAELGQYYTTVTNSAYFDWLSEYDANGMHIGRGSFAGAYTLSSPPGGSSLTNQQIAAAVDAAITAGQLPKNDADSLYMVYFPPGIDITLDGSQSCVTFCAFHDTFARQDGSSLYYGVIPDLSGACSGGCGQGTVFQSTTEVSSHEMIEAVTDPGVGLGNLAWYDDSQGEIGDICNGQAGDVDGYQVQLEWSNRNNACIATDPNVPPPSDAGAPPPVDAGQPPPVDAGGPPPQDDAGTPPPPDDAGAPPPPPDDAGTGTCPSEEEPNDISDWADPLDTCLVGTLDPPGDVDWSSFSLSGSVDYDIVLAATDDARVRLYKLVDDQWVRVASTSPTEIKHRSMGGGHYLVVVWSPSYSTQDYTLTRN